MEKTEHIYAFALTTRRLRAKNIYKIMISDEDPRELLKSIKTNNILIVRKITNQDKFFSLIEILESNNHTYNKKKHYYKLLETKLLLLFSLLEYKIISKSNDNDNDDNKKKKYEKYIQKGEKDITAETIKKNPFDKKYLFYINAPATAIDFVRRFAFNENYIKENKYIIIRHLIYAVWNYSMLKNLVTPEKEYIIDDELKKIINVHDADDKDSKMKWQQVYVALTNNFINKKLAPEYIQLSDADNKKETQQRDLDKKNITIICGIKDKTEIVVKEEIIEDKKAIATKLAKIARRNVFAKKISYAKRMKNKVKKNYSVFLTSKK